MKLTLNPRLRDHVIAKLGEGWSPQQIAGRLKHDALPLGTVALTALARRLNDTPRRRLGYRTPAEVFAANLASLAISAQVGNPEHPLSRPLAPVGPQA